MSHSIAVKCIYNDADEGPLVGFKGACSLDLMQQYVQRKDIHCGRELCPCHTYYFRGRMHGRRPAFPCMESRLFRDWEVTAGAERGPLNGSLQQLTDVQPGQFAVLTTTFLGALEKERSIIGLFQIGEITVSGEEARVVAAPNGRLRLPLEEARQLSFWAYCDSESHRPEWHHGLFRALENSQVHRILVDLADTVRDEKTKAKIERLVRSTFGPDPAPPASGCLAEKSVSRKRQVAQARKYGPGGEGSGHRRLREFLQRYPEEIGITDSIRAIAEYVFPSGASADLVFQRHDGGWCVLAIETLEPLAGAYRAIEQRALLCADKGLALNDPGVDAFLVARSIPASVEDFCIRYGVLTRKLRLP
jgi:hypothetical protein